MRAAQCARLCSQNCESRGPDFSFARAFDPFWSILGVAAHSVEKSPHRGSKGHVICLRDLGWARLAPKSCRRKFVEGCQNCEWIASQIDWMGKGSGTHCSHDFIIFKNSLRYATTSGLSCPSTYIAFLASVSAYPSFFSHLRAHSTETLVWPRSRPMAGMIVLLMCCWRIRGVIYVWKSKSVYFSMISIIYPWQADCFAGVFSKYNYEIDLPPHPPVRQEIGAQPGTRAHYWAVTGEHGAFPNPLVEECGTAPSVT